MKSLLYEGAEARIYIVDKGILKERISKGYRRDELDKKIRKSRTRSEIKVLKKCLENHINVPKVLGESEFSILMEFIGGRRLSEILNELNRKTQQKIMKELGSQISILHKNNIIHGDLTTSNFIYKDEKIFVIDFGLAFISSKIEDKAVDLHLLKSALEAKHWENFKELFRDFLESYKWERSRDVKERLKIVEKRGRYKRHH